MSKPINLRKLIGLVLLYLIPCSLMLIPMTSNAQLSDFLGKQIGNIAGQISSSVQTETQKGKVEASTDQAEAVSIIQEFGLVGSWANNCQDKSSIINYRIENNKSVIRYQRPDSTTYSVIDKAKLLNDKQLHYISQVYLTSNNQPLRKVSAVIYKNDGQTSLVYLEIITDGKSEIVIKDGISLKDNTKQTFSKRCI